MQSAIIKEMRNRNDVPVLIAIPSDFLRFFFTAQCNLRQMNSFKGIVLTLVSLTVIIFTGVRIYLHTQNTVFHSSLNKETVARSLPEHIDTPGSGWVTLSFGYNLGPWPTHFKENPIVMTMDYIKGPPQNFIHEMKQIWIPAQAELLIEGPRTPIGGMTVIQWENCVNSSIFCQKEKKKLYEATLQDLERFKGKDWKITWFESNDLSSPRGLHVQFETASQEINRFVIFTDKGTSQNFTLVTSKTGVGSDALALFYKVLGAMTLKEDLADARAFMKKKLQTIDLEKIRSIPDPINRYFQMIQAQNMLFAELSVDPRLVAPFFHLAGVSHLLGSSLLHEKSRLFGNQDSWTVSIQPLLSNLIKYVQDFPDVGTTKEEKVAALKNMESLLSDYLILEQKEQQKSK